MSILNAVGIIAVFAIFGLLMMTELVPTFVALAAMALGIAVVGGLGYEQILNDVIVGGSTRLSAAFVAVFFGAALGAIVEQTGIAEDLVKTAAELGGDSPFMVAVLLYIAVAVIATSISGLGAFIMIATIVFPIMVSIGFPRKIAAGIVLLGYANGVMFNPANWVFYADVTGIQLQSVMVWALPTGAAALLAGLGYITFQTRTSSLQATWAAEGGTGAENIEQMGSNVPTYALFAPVLPVVLVIAGLPVLPAFVVGILFAAVFSKPGAKGLTNPKQTLNQVTHAFHEGISNAAPAIALMVAIGWLLKAVFAESVATTMEPLLSAIIPENMVLYAVMFIVLAPLALYRGPLNLWGLGSGIIGVLAAIGVNPALITTTAVSALRVQAPADPTNTHNAWTADEMGVNVNAITKSVLPFAWLTAAVGIIASVYLFGV
ncbi:C4-dicarboxylate anaerobic carrier [Halogranum rubrum]|uniref:C4-dicarboxylate anaerobic carrier n=1 Tax=Halogranum rubrum TaxID=553466 RepID=A0A1I4GYF8_9EURY|nr:citrate transporter [Halogranum rubrum]SFL34989.1 C4-dicarboxylate anaerobic carrier [Halogranum rubrum]